MDFRLSLMLMKLFRLGCLLNMLCSTGLHSSFFQAGQNELNLETTRKRLNVASILRKTRKKKLDQDLMQFNFRFELLHQA